MNIQNILQSGFFPTARARQPYSSTNELNGRPSTPPTPSRHQYTAGNTPRSAETKSNRRRPRLPSPTVEDEATSLAREYGGRVLPVAEEEAQSRGEVDQQPLILDVFEFNAERRFVVMPTSSNVSSSDTEDKESRKKAHQEAVLKKKEEIANNTPKDSKVKIPVSRMDVPNRERPDLERRRSRQDLPRIDTEWEEHHNSEHHRSKSCAGDARPNFSPRQRQPVAQDFLVPELNRQAHSVRDTTYRMSRRGSADEGRSPPQSSTGGAFEQKRDEKSRRNGVPLPDRRPGVILEPNPPPRPLSSNQAYEQRTWNREKASRTDLRGNGYDSYRQDNGYSGDRIRHHYTPHESNPLRDDPPEHATHQRVNSMTDRGRDYFGAPGRAREHVGISRSPSRTHTMPIPSSDFSAYPDERLLGNRASTHYPASHESNYQLDNRQSALPYPDDDFMDEPWPASVRDDDLSRPPYPAVSMTAMPHIPTSADDFGLRSDLGARGSSSLQQSQQQQQQQQPLKHSHFRSEGETMRGERPIGAFRRYSESRGQNAQDELPECHRTEPVAGKVDWLTLPKTDFNICPDCYANVFLESSYRTLFQPMLRPTGNAIACDFGSSPWYRIAWLLTLKDKRPDLQMFFKVAAVMKEARAKPCPGERKVSTYWFTVGDPFTRRPIPDFTVCYQCAKTVETLFPNLRDIFVPLEAWTAESTKSICSLHFTPERKQFVLFFDAFETASERAYKSSYAPNVGDLSLALNRISTFNECREDLQVHDQYWYTLEFLPEFTVCGECYDEAVRPLRDDCNEIAQNFLQKPRKLPIATCQLYSNRMREVFRRCCRNNDPETLEQEVRERRKTEDVLQERLAALMREQSANTWRDNQIDKLIRNWRKWE